MSKATKRYYVETGADVSATGAVVEVFCVMDSRHRQIGLAYSHRSSAYRKIRRLTEKGDR